MTVIKSTKSKLCCNCYLVYKGSTQPFETLKLAGKEEAKNFAKESQEIDWQELITLAEAAIEKKERGKCVHYSWFFAIIGLASQQ